MFESIDVLFILEMIGTVAFAASGAMVAIRKNLDLLGILVLGVITAVGGGMIRDLLIGVHPPAMFTHPIYVEVAFVSILFIFYLVILYSIINPLKEFSKAFYNIPLGLASMDRIDMILKAENPIKEPQVPKDLKSFDKEIEFRDVSFSYIQGRPVLKHINLIVPKGKTVALVGQSG